MLGGTALTPNLQVTNANAQPATIVHNRNRTYSPALGRFLQPDPLASGQTVADISYVDGLAADAAPPRFDPLEHYEDGANRFESRKSNALRSTDPSGLSAAALLLPDPLDMAGGGLKALLEEYSERLLLDIEWAMDWTADHDDHSRSYNEWVDAALVRGVYDSFAIGVPYTDIGFNPLDYMGGVGGSKGARPRNYALRGGTHSFKYNGKLVTFNKHGFPNLQGFAIKTVRIKQAGDIKKDFAMADRKAGHNASNPRPSDYTWHHHQDTRRMLLVPTELHRRIGHSGGVWVLKQRNGG